MRNVFQNFSDVYSERVKHLLQNLTSASVSQTGARLWTIEYQDFRQIITFRFALGHFKLSCGNTADRASELRAIDKRFERTQGGAINKAIIIQRLGKDLPL